MKGANGEETPANSYTLSGYSGSLSQFTLYNRASEDAADYQPMQLKNISLKHVNTVLKEYKIGKKGYSFCQEAIAGTTKRKR